MTAAFVVVLGNVGNHSKSRSTLCLISIVAAVAFASAAASLFADENDEVPAKRSDLHGRVLEANGLPVTDATVFTTSPGRSETRIIDGHASFGESDLSHTGTAADGVYELPQPAGKFLLQVVADEGFAEVHQDALSKSSDVQLTPWGRIQGQFMIGSKPAAGVALQATVGPTTRGDLLPVTIVSRAVTDVAGHFVMDRIQPGHVEIGRMFDEQSGPNHMVFFNEAGSVDVVAGETAPVTLGGVGRPVIGKFIFPPTMNPSDFFINARAIPQRQMQRVKSPTTSEDRRSYFLAVDPHQNFRIDNVPTGDYRIHIFLQKVHGDRTLQPDQQQFSVPAIAGDTSDEPLVIPDIKLQ